MNDDNLKPIVKGQTGENHPAKKPATNHRTERIVIMVNKKELEAFRNGATAAGLNPSVYARKLLCTKNHE